MTDTQLSPAGYVAALLNHHRVNNRRVIEHLARTPQESQALYREAASQIRGLATQEPVQAYREILEAIAQNFELEGAES
jgi:hypothetical protein